MCNLECWWCDTAYTWAVTPGKAEKTKTGKQFNKNDPKLGLKRMTIDEIIDDLMRLWDVENDPTIIVISGGEPLMQQQRLIPLLQQLSNWGNEIHIETAGTIMPVGPFDDYIDQYNVSPKLTSSGNLQSKRYKPAVLGWFAKCNRAYFKFVLTRRTWRNDFAEACGIVEARAIPRSHVMMMPEGTTTSDILETAKLISEATLEAGFGLTLREHVLIWGDDVGR
jgi:organic radical activating enzyme